MSLPHHIWSADLLDDEGTKRRNFIFTKGYYSNTISIVTKKRGREERNFDLTDEEAESLYLALCGALGREPDKTTPHREHCECRACELKRSELLKSQLAEITKRETELVKVYYKGKALRGQGEFDVCGNYTLQCKCGDCIEYWCTEQQRQRMIESQAAPFGMAPADEGWREREAALRLKISTHTIVNADGTKQACFCEQCKGLRITILKNKGTP